MFRLSLLVLFCNCNRPLPTYQFNCCLRKNLRILHNCIAMQVTSADLKRTVVRYVIPISLGTL